MTDGLLNCPFCGAPAAVTITSRSIGHSFQPTIGAANIKALQEHY